MYSPNHRQVAGTSQYYHLDGQDIRSLQVFIFLDEVTPDHGPLTLLPADCSSRAVKSLKYRKQGSMKRVSDADVAQFVDLESRRREITAAAGTVLVFDGDRCLHFGSRKGIHPRRVLHLFYMTAFGFTLPETWRTEFSHLLPDRNAPQWQKGMVGVDKR
jgi:hypothetical protein